jgi:hypothetical protein
VNYLLRVTAYINLLRSPLVTECTISCNTKHIMRFHGQSNILFRMSRTRNINYSHTQYERTSLCIWYSLYALWVGNWVFTYNLSVSPQNVKCHSVQMAKVSVLMFQIRTQLPSTQLFTCRYFYYIKLLSNVYWPEDDHILVEICSPIIWSDRNSNK